MSQTRSLAAILAADVAEYSRLMGAEALSNALKAFNSKDSSCSAATGIGLLYI